MTHSAAVAVGAASLTVRAQGDTVVLCFAGRLDVSAAAALWQDTLRAAATAADFRLDLHAVEACDTAGATLLLEAERAFGGTARIDGAEARVAAVLALVRPASAVPAARAPCKNSLRLFTNGDSTISPAILAFPSFRASMRPASSPEKRQMKQ